MQLSILDSNQGLSGFGKQVASTIQSLTRDRDGVSNHEVRWQNSALLRHFWYELGFNQLRTKSVREYEPNLPTPTAQLTTVTDQYPAVVMIILPGDVGMCSGTFISPNTVLTAAHCTLNQGQYMVQASFGTFTTNTTVKFGPGVVNDPNDIALLIFDSNVADRDKARSTISALKSQTATR